MPYEDLPPLEGGEPPLPSFHRDQDGFWPCPVCGDRWGTKLQMKSHWGSAHVRVTEISHGTEGGYSQHRKRGEEACNSCKAAHSKYNVEYRRRTGSYAYSASGGWIDHEKERRRAERRRRSK